MAMHFLLCLIGFSILPPSPATEAPQLLSQRIVKTTVAQAAAEEAADREAISQRMSKRAAHYVQLSEQAAEEKNYDQAISYAESSLAVAQQMLALAEGIDQAVDEDSDELSSSSDLEETRERWIEAGLKAVRLSLDTIALIYDNQDKEDEALEYDYRSLEISKRLGDTDSVVATLSLIQGAHRQLGDYEKALATVRQIFAIAEETANPKYLLDAQWGFARVYYGFGFYAEALDAYEVALKLARQQGKRLDESIIMDNVAIIVGSQGEYASAIKTFEQSLINTRTIRDQIEESTTFGELRAVCESTSETGAAEALASQKQDCLEIYWNREQKTLNNVALTYNQQGRYQEAITSYEQSLKIARDWSEPSAESNVLSNIAVVYYSKGDYNKALELTQESISIGKKIDDLSGLGYALSTLGTINYSRGRYLNALAAHQEALNISRDIDTKPLEAVVLREMALVYREQGRYSQAENALQKALAINEDIRLLSGKGLNLFDLSSIASNRGDYPLAISLLEESLKIYQDIEARPPQSMVLTETGSVYQAQGRFAEAFETHQAAIAIAQELEDKDDEAIALLALGSTYDQLGQYGQAESSYVQALAVLQEIGSAKYEASTLNRLGVNAEEQLRYDEALDFYEQSLAINQNSGNTVRESTVLMNIGLLQAKQNQLAEAKKNLEKSLKIQREIGIRANEGKTLAGLALVAQKNEDSEASMALLQEALVLHRALGDAGGEAAVLAQLGNLLAQSDQLEVGIIFYKQSVNVVEDIRGSLRGLPSDLQESFTGKVSTIYRELADLLLQSDRILEAQAVLDLLRVQELEEYLKDMRSATGDSNNVEYWQVEERILELYSTVVSDREKLLRLQEKARSEGLSPSEEEQLELLKHAQQALASSFFEFSRNPEVASLISQLQSETNGETIGLQGLAARSSQLEALPNAVMIYPLIFEDRLEIVLAAPNVPPIRRPVDIKPAELNKDILEYRQVLSQPSKAAKPIAKKLYDNLVLPIEADLERLGAETILYSPDGALRYIPLSALYDGDQWLAERFSVTYVTDTALNNFNIVPEPNPSILAAACAQCSFADELNSRSYEFSDLPFTYTEVNNIAKQTSNAKVLIDGEFTKQNLSSSIGSYDIVHLATHGAFVSSSPYDSFLVFSGEGEEKIATLPEVSSWISNNTNLVVLSACETALGSETLGSGIEVLGLGYQIQNAGAHAAIASLWKVNDGGTQVLMNAFYQAMGEGYSKIEALRRAQVALIKNDLSIAAGGNARGSWDLVDDNTGEPFALVGEPDHPFYWAPFILIGNGL